MSKTVVKTVFGLGMFLAMNVNNRSHGQGGSISVEMALSLSHGNEIIMDRLITNLPHIGALGHETFINLYNYATRSTHPP